LASISRSVERSVLKGDGPQEIAANLEVGYGTGMTQDPHKKEAHPKASASLFAGFFLTSSFSSCLRGGTPPTA